MGSNYKQNLDGKEIFQRTDCFFSLSKIKDFLKINKKSNELRSKNLNIPNIFITLSFLFGFGCILYLSIKLFYIPVQNSLLTTIKYTMSGICMIYFAVVVIRCKKLNAFSFFMYSTIFLSSIYFFMFLPFNTNDSKYHFSAAYRYSNLILRPHAPEWSGREDDAFFYRENLKYAMPKTWHQHPSRSSYIEYFSKVTLFSKNNELVKMPVMNHMKWYSFLNYFPLSFGIILGRLLHLSSFVTAWIAKFFLLLCYIFTIAHAIKTTPIYKNLIAMLALFPMALMNSSAFSYDGMVLLSSIAFMVSIFKLKFEKGKYTVYECAFWAFFIGGIKGGGYSLLFPLTLCLLNKNDKSSIKNIIFILFWGIFSVFIFDYLLVRGQHFFQVEAIDNNHMMTADAFSNPIQYFKMVIKTYFVNGHKFLMSSVGQNMGWNSYVIPSSVIYGYLGTVIAIGLWEKSKNSFKLFDHVIFFIIILFTLCFIPAMLLRHTRIGSSTISEIQGRYYLPVLPLLIILIDGILQKVIKENFIKKYKDIAYANAYLFFSSLSVISVLIMLNLYLGR